jgi:hypothetical protein
MGKHLLTLAVLFICCTHVSAQLEKGNLYPGLSSENRFRFFNKSFGVKPELSYALDEHSLIGVKLNYFRSNNYRLFYSANDKGYNLQYGAGISYSYFRYFKRSNKFGWYANANLEFNKLKYYDIKNTGQTELTNQYFRTELSLRPGIFYKPSQRVMFFANFGGVSLNNDAGSVTGDFNFASQFNIGVLINLDIFRKKK